MEKTLDTFTVGESGVVKAVLGEGKIKRRLFDMGITPGASIMLKKKAPLGDPIEFNVRGYELSMRKKAPLGDPIEITVRGYELTLRKTEAVCVKTEVKK